MCGLALSLYYLKAAMDSRTMLDRTLTKITLCELSGAGLTLYSLQPSGNDEASRSLYVEEFPRIARFIPKESMAIDGYENVEKEFAAVYELDVFKRVLDGVDPIKIVKSAAI